MPRPKSPVRSEWVDPAVCSLEYRLKIIGRLPFFRQLPESAILEINRLFEDRETTAGQAIYFEGDPATHFYLVSNGKLKLLRHTILGREVLLDILHAGEYFGSLATSAQKSYPETAISQTSGCILQISTEHFKMILSHHPDVTLKVLEAVSKRLEESQELVKQLSAYSIEQRVAATLIRLAKKMGERKQKGLLVQLPFSRQDLAAMTGTTVETVSRVMSRLVEDGLISTGRRWVAVSDLAGLEQVLKVAESLPDAPVEQIRQGVKEVYDFLAYYLIPHAQAEDAALYPAVQKAMGSRDATRTMSRDHVEVGRYVDQLADLHLADDISPRTAKALQRVLYGVYALVKVHFAKEEEVYLPILEAKLSPEAAKEMFAAMEQAAGRAKLAVQAR